MRKLYEAVVILMGTVGWWGFVYPDLCLTEDVYEQEYEEELYLPAEPAPGNAKGCAAGAENTDADKASGKREMAEPVWKMGGLCIKSRILEYVYQKR